MGKKINTAELAKKYAAALFDEAVAHECADDVADELRELGRLMADCPEFDRLMNSRLISANIRAQTVAAIAQKAGLSDVTGRFLGVLADNGRMPLFTKIYDAFTALYEEHKGILSVSVVSAQELNEAARQRLNDVLKRIFNKEIRLSLSVNPSLIGGMTVQVGSLMADASVKTKLQKLNLVMKGVGV